MPKSMLDSELPVYRLRRSLSLPAILCLFVFSSIATSLLGLYTGRHFPTNLDATCTGHVSKYCESASDCIASKAGADGFSAPITEDIDITYSMVKFNGSFEKENIYRQDPSPEVDAAWDDLGGKC